MFFSKPQPIALPIDSSESDSDCDSDYDPEMATRSFGEGRNEDEKGHDGGKHDLHASGEGHDEDKKGPKGPDRPRGPDHKEPGKGPDHKPEDRKDPEDHKDHKEKRRRCHGHHEHHHRKSKFKKVLFTLAHAFIIIVGVRWLFSKFCPRSVFKGFRHHWSGDKHHHGFEPLSEIITTDQCLESAVWSEPVELPPKDDHDHHYHHHHKGKWGCGLSSNASLILPVNSESLAFYSFGPSDHGFIKFVVDEDDVVAADEIAVDIEVHYHDPSAIEDVTVCTLDRETGNGVGIFAPPKAHRARRHHGVKFKVLVRFPKLADQDLVIDSLETHLPFFKHKFLQTAANNVRFNNLILV